MLCPKQNLQNLNISLNCQNNILPKLSYSIIYRKLNYYIFHIYMTELSLVNCFLPYRESHKIWDLRMDYSLPLFINYISAPQLYQIEIEFFIYIVYNVHFLRFCT